MDQQMKPTAETPPMGGEWRRLLSHEVIKCGDQMKGASKAWRYADVFAGRHACQVNRIFRTKRPKP